MVRACTWHQFGGLLLIAIISTATASAASAADHSMQHSRRALQQVKGKHLVYTTWGAQDSSYPRMKWLLMSINHYSHHPNFEFLIICTAAAKQALQPLLPSFLNYKVDFLMLPPKSQDTAEGNPCAHGLQKLHVTQYSRLRKFTNLLYLDPDFEVTLDVANILSNTLQPGILYAAAAQQAILHTAASKVPELHQDLAWGYKNYTDADMATFHKQGVHVFNTNCFMFRNDPDMLEELIGLEKHLAAHSEDSDQRILNYHYNSHLRSNTSLLTPLFLEWWSLAHAVGKYSSHNKLVHFNITDGKDHDRIMHRFYHQEVLGERHKQVALYSSWLETLSAFALESLPEGKRSSWWPRQGHIGQIPREVQRYFTLGARTNVRTICEVGFNAGHSAAVFLAANPSATFYSFDLVTWPYSKRSMSLFRTLYPSSFHFIQGSSFDSVPWLRRNHPEVQCDVFSVDGDHGYEGALTDYLNAMAMMPLGATLVADDVSSRFKGGLQAWEKIVTAGYVVDAECEEPEQTDSNAADAGVKRWCWGTVAAPKMQLQVPRKAKNSSLAMDVFQ